MFLRTTCTSAQSWTTLFDADSNMENGKNNWFFFKFSSFDTPSLLARLKITSISDRSGEWLWPEHVPAHREHREHPVGSLPLWSFVLSPLISTQHKGLANKRGAKKTLSCLISLIFLKPFIFLFFTFFGTNLIFEQKTKFVKRFK